jgi:hypothetical protein
MEQKHNAAKLFQLEVDSDCIFPLNIKFEATEDAKQKINSTGIYFLTYKGELLYIGYAVQQEALDRMRRQLEGITLRGSRVAFNDLAVLTIENSDILRPFFNATILERRNGFVTSEKRVLFAENHWKDFAFLDKCILSNFAFDWFPVDSDVEEKCNQLKNKFHPRCNNEGSLPRDFEIELSKF